VSTGPLVAELIIVGWFSALGACVVSLVRPSPALRWPSVLLAPLVGITASGVIGSIVTALELTRMPWFVAIVGAAVCAVAIVDAWRRRAVVSLATSGAVAVVLGVAAVCVLFVSIRPVLTFDSYRLIMIGRAARSGRLTNGSAAAADFPFMISHVQAIARGLRAEYSVYAANAAACLGLTGAVGVAAGSVPAADRRTVQVLSGIALTVVVLATYVVRIQLGYLNSHLVAAALFTAVVALIAWCERHGGCAPEMAMIGILLGGYAIVRVEGLLVVTILVVVLVGAVPLTVGGAIRVGLLGVVLPGLWYAALALGGARGDILSPPTLAVLLVAPCVALAIGLLPPTNPVRQLASPRVMIVVMLLGTLAQTVLRRPEAPKSAAVMVQNLLVDGRWGPVWWLVIALPVALWIQPDWPTARSRSDSPVDTGARTGNVWTGAIGAYVAMVALLGVVRSLPYRIGWSDSGNRMLVHVVPAIVVGFTMTAVRIRGRRGLDADVDPADGPVAAGHVESLESAAG
jgi:hypothetical protein